MKALNSIIKALLTLNTFINKAFFQMICKIKTLSNSKIIRAALMICLVGIPLAVYFVAGKLIETELDLGDNFYELWMGAAAIIGVLKILLETIILHIREKGNWFVENNRTGKLYPCLPDGVMGGYVACAFSLILLGIGVFITLTR